ncbi:MAG: SCP2 domain-containing protein [Massilia sp.]
MSNSSAFLPDLSLATPAVAAINHLLAQESWARDALAKHAGKLALIDTGAVGLRLQVTSDGMLEAGSADAMPAVTIRIKLSDLPLIAQHRDRAFSYVKIEGDAEFANTISQLSKGLRWEAEADLERLAGPIAATRLTGGARRLFAAAEQTRRRLSENVAEFLAEEQAVLVRPALLKDMGEDIVRLRDDVERAAKRLTRLEQQFQARQQPLQQGSQDAAPRLPPSLDR